MRTVLFAAVLAVSPTAHANDLRLAFDPSLTAAEQEKARSVVTEWNIALQGVRRINLASGGWLLTFGNTRTTGGGCAGGNTDYGRRVITLSSTCMPAAQFAPTLRHELGHALGLGHTIGTVMDPQCCSASQAVDADSAARAREVVAVMPAIITVTK